MTSHGEAFVTLKLQLYVIITQEINELALLLFVQKKPQTTTTLTRSRILQGTDFTAYYSHTLLMLAHAYKEECC